MSAGGINGARPFVLARIGIACVSQQTKQGTEGTKRMELSSVESKRAFRDGDLLDKSKRQGIPDGV